MLVKKILVCLSLSAILPLSSVCAGNGIGKPEQNNEKRKLFPRLRKGYKPVLTPEQKRANALEKKERQQADAECTMRYLREGGFNFGPWPEENKPD